MWYYRSFYGCYSPKWIVEQNYTELSTGRPRKRLFLGTRIELRRWIGIATPSTCALSSRCGSRRVPKDIKLPDEGIMSMSSSKIPAQQCDTAFLRRHETRAQPLRKAQRQRWLCVGHAVSVLSKCLHWHMICVQWYCQCPSMFPDTHVRGCDWLMGFDRAENWSSARSKAQSSKAVKWQYWVMVSVLYQIREQAQCGAASEAHYWSRVQNIIRYKRLV